MDNKIAFLIHTSICLAVGGLIAYFTPAKWLAASFLVSASLVFNGRFADYEDALPGGFDNPNGTEVAPFTQGFGAFKYWSITLGVCGLLASIAGVIQWYI